MIYYQDRRATADNDVKINGNSSSKIEGALYFPRADLDFTGTTGQNTNCMQIVTKRVTFIGNSASPTPVRPVRVRIPSSARK